jgi:hypothetical protein
VQDDAEKNLQVFVGTEKEFSFKEITLLMGLTSGSS